MSLTDLLLLSLTRDADLVVIARIRVKRTRQSPYSSVSLMCVVCVLCVCTVSGHSGTGYSTVRLLYTSSHYFCKEAPFQPLFAVEIGATGQV